MLILTAAAACCAAGNLWHAAARSTIPLDLDNRIKAVEMRREKHPGRDDVYLLTLNDGRVLQVDRSVAAAVEPGAAVSKDAWSRTLRVDSRVVELNGSADLHGMIRAMTVVGLIVTCTAVWVGMHNSKTGPSRDALDRRRMNRDGDAGKSSNPPTL